MRSNPSWLRLSSLALPRVDSFERPGLNGLNMDMLTSSVPESLDHLEDVDVDLGAESLEGSDVESGVALDTNKDSTWNNLFNLAGNQATVSGWGIDIVAP